MVVTVKSLDGNELLDLLKIDSALLDWLKSQKIVVQVTATAIAFKSPGGDKLTSIPVKFDHLTKLKKGMLGPLALASLKEMVTGGVEAMQKGVVSTKVGALALLKANVKQQSEHSAFQPLLEAAGMEPTPGTALTSWPVFDLAQLQTAEPVKLRDADKLYQPVRGSSPGSRYFLVAANPDLRVGARYKGTSLSVRIEGPAWEKYHKQIVQCGFDNISNEKGYASVHLSVPDPVIAGKALGAILLGLGVPLETPIPDLSVIKDAGK